MPEATPVECEVVPTLTVGLLGAQVPDDWGIEQLTSPAGVAYMRDLRLQEIERRILRIEAGLNAVTETVNG